MIKDAVIGKETKSALLWLKVSSDFKAFRLHFCISNTETISHAAHLRASLFNIILSPFYKAFVKTDAELAHDIKVNFARVY